MLPQEPGRTFVFECSGNTGQFNVITRTGPGELAVWLPPAFGRRYLVLGQVRAASGAKYEGDGVMIWSKGSEAMIEIDGQRFDACRENRRLSIWEHAKLSGVDFRAVGNEPGWYMEIRNGERIDLVYDYGESELRVPAPEPSIDAAERRSIYRSGDGTTAIEVTIESGPCNDTMSGESFESRATVVIDGRTLHGCGRALH